VFVSLIGSSFVLWFSKDLTALGILDDWVGTLGIFILATVQIICFGWIFGIDRGWKEMHEGAQMRLWPFFKFMIRYVTPLFLLVVFAAFCSNNLGDWVAAVAANPVKQMSIGLIVATILMLVVITRIGEKRWRAMGLDLDGQLPPADEMKNNAKGGL
jgi:NSS family neurotransmitter:Na+ symporter